MGNIKFESNWGDTFQEVAESAKAMAYAHDATVEFDFNGILCLVNKDTVTDNLWKHYLDSHIMDWKTIGPDCKAEYDAPTTIELADRRLVQAKRWEREAEEMRQKDQAEREAAEAKIQGVVLLIHSDKQNEYEEYVAKNSNDGYSRADS